MSNISLEGMVDKPVDSDGVLVFDRQPTPSQQTTIDGIAAENPSQQTQFGNETARERPAGFYERVRVAVSQIKPKALVGFRRAALATTLAGVLAACSVAASTSSGVKVAYPPDFTCYQIAIDYGIPITIEGKTIPHPGIDVVGKRVIAPADGMIRSIEWNDGPGYEISLIHFPNDLGIPNTYALSWFAHLKEFNGKNSALKYVKVGDRVFKGQPIADVGRTGRWATYEHSHWQLLVTRDRLPRNNVSEIVNNHDWWGPHPLDKPGEVKYIPFLSEGEKYDGPKGGFILPVLCPPRKKISLSNGRNEPLEITLNFDYARYPILGLDLDTFRESMIRRIKSQPYSQLKKAA